METEMHILEVSPLLVKTKPFSCSFSCTTTTTSIEYTSLKDILLLDSPTGNGGSSLGLGHDYHCFDSSSICIRNHLVKHAASAYLQSAAVLAARNQSCMTRFWQQLQRRMQRPCGWRECVGLITRSVQGVFFFLAGHARRVWVAARRTTIA